MKQVREARLPELDPFLRGLDQDHGAAIAGLTLPCSNGPIEGVNTKTDQTTDVWPRRILTPTAQRPARLASTATGSAPEPLIGHPLPVLVFGVPR